MRHLLLIESFDSSDRIGNASSCDSGTGKFVVTPAMERSLEGKILLYCFVFFFSSRRRHTRCSRDWSSDVCSSDLRGIHGIGRGEHQGVRRVSHGRAHAARHETDRCLSRIAEARRRRNGNAPARRAGQAEIRPGVLRPHQARRDRCRVALSQPLRGSRRHGRQDPRHPLLIYTRLTVLLVALATPLAAQTAANPKHEWVDHLYPYVSYSSVDGFWAAGHYDWSSPMGFADRPEPNFGRVAFDAAASTQGSYLVMADAQAPAYWDGWRLGLILSLARANRLGYYGQGNNTGFDRDSTTLPGHSYFYRVSRKTGGARLTVQRRVAGPLRVLVGGTLEHTAFRALPGVTLYQRDSVGGYSDAIARGGIVFDSRDLEADPHRGIFAQALVGRGRGYTRTTAPLRGDGPPPQRLILSPGLGKRRVGEKGRSRG